MSIRIIPATRPEHRTPSPLQPKLRVCAYCRVSTDGEDQETSYEGQVNHYTDYISNHEGWELAGIFADEGLSGTSTAKREQFNAMIAACEAGRVDLVITKSISRWARNTLDSLQNIRKLRALGIPVIFEKENCNTMESSGELLITILSSLAQQESQSISQNVRIGLQYGFQQGKPMLTHTTFMGYTKNRGDMALTIVPEEAQIVRRIYRDFLEGYTPGEIAEALEREGVKSPAGRDTWYTSTILSMLKNEKMMGDLLLQKSYVVDFLTKKKARNYGQLPQYYVENAHPPIVPKEVFMRVQGILLQQAQTRYERGKWARPSTHMPLNGLIICGDCGRTYRRFTSSRLPPVWRCRGRGKAHHCPMRPVDEAKVKATLVTAFNRLPECRELLVRMQERIQWGPLTSLSHEIEAAEAERAELQNLLSECARTGHLDPRVLLQYGDEGAAIAHIQGELNALNAHREDLLIERAGLTMKDAQIRTLMKLTDRIAPPPAAHGVCALAGLQPPPRPDPGADPDACTTLADFFDRTDRIDVSGPVAEYREDMVKRYIQSITVHPDHLTVHFKAGIDLKI